MVPAIQLHVTDSCFLIKWSLVELFFRKRFIYSFESDIEKKRDRDLPYTDSLPANGCIGWGWAMPKQGGRNFPWAIPVGVGHDHMGLPCGYGMTTWAIPAGVGHDHVGHPCRCGGKSMQPILTAFSSARGNRQMGRGAVGIQASTYMDAHVLALPAMPQRGP